jgi:hypothetical protein
MDNIIIPGVKYENGIVYCQTCNPPIAFGWGGYLSTTTQRHYHEASKTVHNLLVKKIDSSEKPNNGESQSDFLLRMTAKYL